MEKELIDEKRKYLADSIQEYIRATYQELDQEYIERITTGVLAFISVNMTKDPFTPIGEPFYLESDKKWYQFWK